MYSKYTSYPTYLHIGESRDYRIFSLRTSWNIHRTLLSVQRNSFNLVRRTLLCSAECLVLEFEIPVISYVIPSDKE